MANYSHIRLLCKEYQHFNDTIIDTHLLRFAARNDQMKSLVNNLRIKYKKAYSLLPESFNAVAFGAFVVHKIFKKDGFIKNYFRSGVLDTLTQKEKKYIEQISSTPWRFAYLSTIDNPENEFFNVLDVFRDEELLIYSKGMQETLRDITPSMWFVLIYDNGTCWRTYGPIIPFKSLTPDDVFFFASELNPAVEDEITLLDEIDNNPFPFLMLTTSSDHPITMSKGFKMVTCQSTDFVEHFSIDQINNAFEVAWNKNIYQLKLKGYDSMPHYAVAYYNEKTLELLRFAMTTEGFYAMTRALQTKELELSMDSDIMISPMMLVTTERMLNKKIHLTPYDSLFTKKMDPKEEKQMKQINHFMDLIMPHINNRTSPDLESLAKIAGIDKEEALSLWNQMKKIVEKP